MYIWSNRATFGQASVITELLVALPLALSCAISFAIVILIGSLS